MKKKTFVDYKEFLKVAFENKEKITDFKYFDNRLFSFKTGNLNCKYLFDNGVLTPNKFVSLLGFENYSAFINKKFSKLKEFAPTQHEAVKWYNGYFGGIVGVNRHIINDYVGAGEVFEFYDYDINKAYLYQLTQFLPTKFVTEMSVEDFNQLNDVDKIGFAYFFEIEVSTVKSQFLKAIGKIKEIYKSFDFLNSKQGEKMIVSEKRLSLINQIYFKDYEIKKVFVFETGKYKFYENILNKYCEVKDSYGPEFKKNALRLYGTFGQIYKYKPNKLTFDKDGNLLVNHKKEINFKSSPQVAMWVADCVATLLFDLISSNMDKIICWNTDGVTSTKPLNLQISKKPGKWKLHKITATPFLFNETGARLFFKDVKNNEIYGANNVVEENGKFYEVIELTHSNLHKGFVKEVYKSEIKKTIVFDEMKTFRNLILKDNFIKKISREYLKF